MDKIIFKPTPREGESRDDFMERCIPMVIDDGTAEDNEQAVAVCSSMWEQGQEGEQESAGKIIKTVPIQILKLDGNGGRIVISTGDVDRDQDRVIPAGARIDDYMKNPIVCFAHNYSEPWATIGRTSRLEIGKDGIVAEFELRPAANENDPQNIVRLLWEGQWIRTASIGFMPMQFDENEHGGRDYNDWQLLEWSLVPVPANQNALRMAVKALDEDDATDHWTVSVTPIFTDSLTAIRDNQIKSSGIAKRGRVLSGANENKLRKARDLLSEVISQVEDQEDEKSIDDQFVWDVVQKFSGSPRNPYGTHSSYKFKGGADGYKRAWRLHFSQIGGGSTSGSASGPIRGTVRRTEMIAAARKPPCQLPSTDSVGARTGPKSPLDGSFPEKPGDYGLSSWKKPETDADKEGVKLSCSDLATIKRAALAEIKRRANDREDDGKTIPDLRDKGDDEPITDEPTDASPTDDTEPGAEMDAGLVSFVEQFIAELEQQLEVHDND